MTMIAFETERLIIRGLTENDRDAFFLLNGSEEVMRYIRPVKTKAESDAHFEQVMALGPATPSNGRWAVEEKTTGLFIGSFAIIPVPNDPERTQLGYTLIPGYWGRGLATEMTKAALTYFFQSTDIPVIYATTETGNLASQQVLLKAGFVFDRAEMEDGKEVRIYKCDRGFNGSA